MLTFLKISLSQVTRARMVIIMQITASFHSVKNVEQVSLQNYLLYVLKEVCNLLDFSYKIVKESRKG